MSAVLLVSRIMVKWLQRNPRLYGHVLGESPLTKKLKDKSEKYESERQGGSEKLFDFVTK